MDFLREYLAFLKTHKKLWLIPLFLTLALVGGLILISGGAAVTPFVYTLF